MCMSVFVSLCELVPMTAGIHGIETLLDPLQLELQAKGVSHPAWVLETHRSSARTVGIQWVDPSLQPQGADS